MAGVSVAIWAPAHLNRDRLFKENRDDCLAAFRSLKARIEQAGGQCRTHDLFQADGVVPDFVIFMDIPAQPVRKLVGSWFGRTRCWVILQEPGLILPRNYDLERHGEFERIFTWDDRLVDGSRYLKLNYGHLFPEEVSRDVAGQRKLCVMIAGNRKSDRSGELYSERESAIRWFEERHPADFDLYGFGWDRRVFAGNRLLRGLNRMTWLARLLVQRHPSWRGTVASKRPVLKQYRFAICYENCDSPGYVTEKIFDCFFAGCVPVYWGASNVTERIPAGCFIDKRKFPDYEELYRFMKSMSDLDYRRYLDNIETFLGGDRAYAFSCQAFAETVANGIICE